MFQVEATVSYYQHQVKVKHKFHAERGNPHLVGWLNNRVAPVVEKWLSDCRFQHMATFSLQRLARPNTSEEYAALEAVHAAIVKLASSLSAVIEQPTVQKHLKDQCGFRRWAEQIFGKSPGTWFVSTLKRLRTISQLPLTSFVSETDFFSPSAGLCEYGGRPILLYHLTTPSRGQLDLPGDMVFWCLQVRLEFFCDELHRLVNTLTSLPTDLRNSTFLKTVAGEAAALHQAEHNFREKVQLSTERRQSESAVIVLQAFSAARLTEILDWLDLNPKLYRCHRSLAVEIHREVGIAVTDHVLAALNEVRGILEIPKSREDWIEELKESHRILMVNGGEEIYFKGDLIVSNGVAEDSGKRLGVAQDEFLAKLIELAKDDKSISREDFRAIRSKKNDQARQLFSELATSKALRDRRSKLNDILSDELNAYILSEGNGRYRLNIPPEEIHILNSSEE